MAERVRLQLNPLAMMTPADRLKTLAGQIQTLDELDGVIAQIAPEMREEVRSLLEPMLSFDPETGLARQPDDPRH